MRDVAGRDTGRLNWWGLEIDYDPRQEAFQGIAAPNLAIPDNSPAGVESIITVVMAGAASAIVVGVEIKHSYQGDLIVEVEAPSGRNATLHSLTGGTKDDLRPNFDSASLPALGALVGEQVKGDWKLRVRDTAAIDIGTLEKWRLSLRF